jgi:N-methylhydantoinase B
VNGGEPGKRARKIIEKADGTQIVVGNKVDAYPVSEGDLLHFITWGGGGWGDPLERDPQLVGLEIAQGLVSPQGAKVYGVIADEEGVVDDEETQALRAQMLAGRGPLPVFNFGPSIETLRANCEAETGLKAPVQPVWETREAAK